MLTRIRLHNYMSHVDTQLELHPGVNVIIGPNNCGKSAIVSALQTLLGENAGDYMVRHGEKECIVEVHTDDPHVIVWKRRGGAIRYQIDGKEFARAGRGNFPDGFPETVRLTKVTTADEKKSFDVHFGQQKSPIFLLDSEGDTAKFFSTTSDAERLIEMQVRHRNNTRDAAARHKDTLRALTALETQLASLAALDELDRQIEQVDNQERALLEAKAELSQIATQRSQLSDAQIECQRLQRLLAEYSRLLEPPLLENTGVLEADIEQLARAERALYRQIEHTKLLSDLNAPPDLADLSAITAATESIAKAERHVLHAQQVHDALTDLAQAPAVLDVAPLVQLVVDLEASYRECTRLAAATECLARLSEAPTLEDASVIERCVKSIDAAAAAVRKEHERLSSLDQLREPVLQEDPTALGQRIMALEHATTAVKDQRGVLQRLAVQLAELEAQAELWRKANPYCPTCGQAILKQYPLLDSSDQGAKHDHC